MQCSQKDMFSVPRAPGPSRVVLELRKIPAPRHLKQKTKTPIEELPDNFHIPSFKNAKVWIMKLPNGKSLRRPLLITSPEFQDWKTKAVLSLESQLLSLSVTECGATQPAPSRLLWILSLLPADDSVNDLPEGSWTVKRVNPGEEGARIVIERLP